MDNTTQEITDNTTQEIMDNTTQDPSYETQKVKDLRVKIDACIQEARELQKNGSRALSLVVTKLEEAKMWAGKRFEELGRELPKEYQDKAE